MTTYRLDHLDGGTLTLPSGNWRWYVIRLNSLPEDRCEIQHLIFANESFSGDFMRAEVPSNIMELDDAGVREYARNPDDRSFRTSSGRFRIWLRGEDGFGRMWQLQPANGPSFRTNKYIEKLLGELTTQELADVASSPI